MTASVCLALNVRDAEKHVGRCIKAARMFPGVDRALIIDTGSVDNTIAVAKEALEGLPTRFLKRRWISHAVNRTNLLKHGRRSGADYVLMLDADMELVQQGETRPLVKDEYLIPVRDRGLVYPLPLLTSTRKHFFYEGVAHAYLCCGDPPSQGELLTEWALIDHGGGGHRPGKIEEDARLLAEAVGKNPADTRSWFYLAQSYRDLDRVGEAIAAYKIRASLGGWSEEVYQALYQGGMLMCEHVNYYDGAKMLIAAAEMKPNRAEALRALAGCSASVADKLPFPLDEVLFVEPNAYREQKQPAPAAPQQAPPESTETPPRPDIQSKRRRRRRGVPIKPSEISAIIVTRGNVSLDPILEQLPYDDVIIWDNSKRPHDYKPFGRYAAIPEAKHPVIFWQDDDVLFTAHDQLLTAYQPGVVIANMDEPWVRGAGYTDDLVLMGAGSLCDAHLPHEVFDYYLRHYPFDADLLMEADFTFGTIAWKTGHAFRVDLGYETREFADDPDRLYQQPGQLGRKWDMIDRCKRLVAADLVAA